MKTKERSKIGKKNRKSGSDFERRTRADLESKGWIVDKWSNNVEFQLENLETNEKSCGKLIPAKHKFRGKGIPMAMGTGFPDFIAYKFIMGFPEEEDKVLLCSNGLNISTYEGWEIIGVECKTNGYLSKEEKEKCKWILENNIFSKILIAYKEKEGRKIVVKYKEFKDV